MPHPASYNAVLSGIETACIIFVNSYKIQFICATELIFVCAQKSLSESEDYLMQFISLELVLHTDCQGGMTS